MGTACVPRAASCPQSHLGLTLLPQTGHLWDRAGPAFGDTEEHPQGWGAAGRVCARVGTQPLGPEHPSSHRPHPQATQPTWPPRTPLPLPGWNLGRASSTRAIPPPCASSPACPAAPLVSAACPPGPPEPPLPELHRAGSSPICCKHALLSLRPPSPVSCSHPQGAAAGPSSPSTTTARHGCGAGAAARPCSSSAARHGPACGSTTWRPTRPAPRWKVRAPVGVGAGRARHCPRTRARDGHVAPQPAVSY